MKRYTAKTTSMITPCRSLVRPVRNHSNIIKRDNRNNTVDFIPMPSVSGSPLDNETKATAGIVSPMLASAEPSDKFKLDCN
jgi:hypothetical protein